MEDPAALPRASGLEGMGFRWLTGAFSKPLVPRLDPFPAPRPAPSETVSWISPSSFNQRGGTQVFAPLPSPELHWPVALDKSGALNLTGSQRDFIPEDAQGSGEVIDPIGAPVGNQSRVDPDPAQTSDTKTEKGNSTWHTPIEVLGETLYRSPDGKKAIRRIPLRNIRLIKDGKEEHLEGGLVNALREMDTRAALAGRGRRLSSYTSSSGRAPNVYFTVVKEPRRYPEQIQTHYRITAAAIVEVGDEGDTILRHFAFSDLADGGELAGWIRDESETFGRKIVVRFNFRSARDASQKLNQLLWQRALLHHDGYVDFRTGSLVTKDQINRKDREITSAIWEYDAAAAQSALNWIEKLKAENASASLISAIQEDLDELRYLAHLTKWAKSQGLRSTEVGFLPSPLLPLFDSPESALRRMTEAIQSQGKDAKVLDQVPLDREDPANSPDGKGAAQVKEGVVIIIDRKNREQRIKLRWIQWPNGAILVDNGRLIPSNAEDINLPPPSSPPDGMGSEFVPSRPGFFP